MTAILFDKGADLAEESKDLWRMRYEFNEKDVNQKERERKDRQLTKGVNWSKVHFLLQCTYYNAVRCVFSCWAIGKPKGPTKNYMDALQKCVDQNEYKCVDIIRVTLDGTVYTEHSESEDEEGSGNEPILFCKEVHVCGTAIESHYYSPGDMPRKGGRFAAKYICCLCYTDRDLADRKDVMKKHTLASEGVLPICRSCLKDGAMPVITRGEAN